MEVFYSLFPSRDVLNRPTPVKCCIESYILVTYCYFYFYLCLYLDLDNSLPNCSKRFKTKYMLDISARMFCKTAPYSCIHLTSVVSVV